MTRLKHPHMRDTHVEVPSEDVERWLAQGWLREEEAEPVTDTPDPEPTGEDHDHSEENA